MSSKLRQGLCLLICIVVVLAGTTQLAWAREIGEIPSDWSKFRLHIEEQEEAHRFEGLAYMVSGGAVLIGSTIGLERSDDVLAKSVYSISQSLSIASIGYGAYLYSIGNEDRSFFNIIENSRSLTPAQKNEILNSYRDQKSDRKRKERLIRIVTHGLIAAANFYSASQESDPGLRTALYFVGGVNAIAAVSIAF